MAQCCAFGPPGPGRRPIRTRAAVGACTWRVLAASPEACVWWTPATGRGEQPWDRWQGPRSYRLTRPGKPPRHCRGAAAVARRGGTPQTHTPPRPSPSRSLARGGDGRRPRVRPCLPPRFKQGALVPHTPTQRGRGRRAAHLHRSQCVVGVCGDDHTRQVWRTLRRNAAKSTISTADSDPAGWNGRAGCRDPSPHGGATCAGEGAGRDSLRWRPATCPLPCVG